jgi:hypothetical protein
MPVYSYSQLKHEVLLSLYLYEKPTTPSTPKTDETLIRPSGEVLKIDVDPVGFCSNYLKDLRSRGS